MSLEFDRMKLPHGGQMGSLKISIVVGAAELPIDTPSSRTRSSTASGGGAADVGVDVVDGDDDCHGWAATTASPPTKATTTVTAAPTHSQGLRLPRCGWPHSGAPVLPTSPVPQAGAPGHPVGWGMGPPGTTGDPAAGVAGHTWPCGGAWLAMTGGGTDAKPLGCWPA